MKRCAKDGGAAKVKLFDGAGPVVGLTGFVVGGGAGEKLNIFDAGGGADKWLKIFVAGN